MRSILSFVVLAACATLSAAQPSLEPPGAPGVESRRFGLGTAINTANTPGDSDSLFKITRPGRYYLGGSVRVLAFSGFPPSTMIAIEIAASDVTLDLNGFTISRGPLLAPGETDPEFPAETLPTAAIEIVGDDIRGVEIRNGKIRGHAYGVVTREAGGLSFGTGARYGKVSDLDIRTASLSSGGGIVVGDGWTFEDCLVRSPSRGVVAISAEMRGCTIEADENGYEGILALIESSRIISGNRGVSSAESVIRGSTIIADEIAVAASRVVIEGCRVESTTSGQPTISVSGGVINGCTVVSPGGNSISMSGGVIADTAAVGGSAALSGGVVVTGSDL